MSLAMSRCVCFNPSTGLMIVSTPICTDCQAQQHAFQSLDWVDDCFDLDCAAEQGDGVVGFNPSTGLMIVSTGQSQASPPAQSRCFNPSTGLMIVSTGQSQASPPAQSRCFNPSTGLMIVSTPARAKRRGGRFGFQSLDWVDDCFDQKTGPEPDSEI